jgi:hypothetical protein
LNGTVLACLNPWVRFYQQCDDAPGGL